MMGGKNTTHWQLDKPTVVAEMVPASQCAPPVPAPSPRRAEAAPIAQSSSHVEGATCLEATRRQCAAEAAAVALEIKRCIKREGRETPCGIKREDGERETRFPPCRLACCRAGTTAHRRR